MSTTAIRDEYSSTFNHFTGLTFAEQAMSFLNAFWEEIGDQAEFIWEAYNVMRNADMHTKGVKFVPDYREASALDFNAGLYFYEKLYHYVTEDPIGRKWSNDVKYAKSMPQMMTAVDRKKALRAIDINADNKISFIEYLLDQYKDACDPNEYSERAMKTLDTEENPELRDAHKALTDLNMQVNQYERKKRQLEQEVRDMETQNKQAKLKQKKFELKNLKSKFKEEGLESSLLRAQAIVRKVSKQAAASSNNKNQPQGTAWWLQRELQEKKKLYGDNINLLNKKRKPSAQARKKSANSWINK